MADNIDGLYWLRKLEKHAQPTSVINDLMKLLMLEEVFLLIKSRSNATMIFS